jgi:hypothetical protein
VVLPVGVSLYAISSWTAVLLFATTSGVGCNQTPHGGQDNDPDGTW